MFGIYTARIVPGIQAHRQLDKGDSRDSHIGPSLTQILPGKEIDKNSRFSGRTILLRTRNNVQTCLAGYELDPNAFQLEHLGRTALSFGKFWKLTDWTGSQALEFCDKDIMIPSLFL